MKSNGVTSDTMLDGPPQLPHLGGVPATTGFGGTVVLMDGLEVCAVVAAAAGAL